MKISIDTKEDSIEDIKRLIHMLQNFVDHRQHSSSFNDIFNKPQDPVTQNSGSYNPESSGLFNMFSSDSDDQATPKQEKTITPKVQIVEY